MKFLSVCCKNVIMDSNENPSTSFVTYSVFMKDLIIIRENLAAGA